MTGHSPLSVTDIGGRVSGPLEMVVFDPLCDTSKYIVVKLKAAHLFTNKNTPFSSIEALKLGALDFIEKPLGQDNVRVLWRKERF